MKKQKGVLASRGSVIFYVMAVIFLLATVFSIYQAYTVIQFNKAQYPLQLMDIINVYVQGCLPSLAYACILYGIGVIVSNIHDVNKSLSLCSYDAVEVEETKDGVVEDSNMEEQEVQEGTANETLEEKQEQPQP